MISRRHVLACAAAIALVAVSPAAPQAQEAKLPVVASFSILGDMVQTIGGDRISLTTLVKPGMDAHVYAPTPADAKAVGEARLVVTNGLGFEPWMRRLMQASASKAQVAEAARSVKALKEKGGHGHSHGHAHAGTDPHAWQSVANAKLYAAGIRDALAAADPSGKDTYEANARRYVGELDGLEAEIVAAIARIPAERRKIITSHDAFAYFEHAYGLRFVAPRGASTAAEPSAQDVARIIRQIRQETIPTVFMENISDPRLIRQIAAESDAKMGGALFSDALSASDGPAPTYIRMMRHNIRVISEALTPRG